MAVGFWTLRMGMVLEKAAAQTAAGSERGEELKST